MKRLWSSFTLGFCVATGSLVACADGTPYQEYHSLVEKGGAPNGPNLESVCRFLTSLRQDEFMSLLKEIWKEDQYKGDNRDIGVAMGVFAHCYIAGPGKDETLVETLRQVADPAMLYWWRMALLGVLHLDDRGQLPVETIAEITATLCRSATDGSNPDLLRSDCLKHLARFLRTQQECIVKQYPNLRGGFDSRDKSELERGIQLSGDVPVSLPGAFLEILNQYDSVLETVRGGISDEQAKRVLGRP